MSEVLWAGDWCCVCEANCHHKNADPPLNPDHCDECGCLLGDHRKVKVIKDKDDEEEVAWVLDLMVKTHNALLRAGIHTIGDLRKRIDQEDPHLMDVRGIGSKGYEKIIDELRRFDEANGRP